MSSSDASFPDVKDPNSNDGSSSPDQNPSVYESFTDPESFEDPDGIFSSETQVPSPVSLKDSVNQALVSRLSQLPKVHKALSNAFGVSQEQLASPSSLKLLGFYGVSSELSLMVYAVSDFLFVLHDVTSDQRSFTLSLPLSRIRRVAVFADLQFTRLIIEIEADRVTSTTSNLESGPQSVSTPAGYEIVEPSESSEPLLEFYAALSKALSSRNVL